MISPVKNFLSNNIRKNNNLTKCQVISPDNNSDFFYSSGGNTSVKSFKPAFKGIVLSEANLERKRKFPADEEYRAELSKNIGCHPDNLICVVGPDELKDRLEKLHYADYSPHHKDDGIFKANLHLHTTASDGKLTPDILFGSIASYYEGTGNSPFMVAISDHDNANGVKEALKYISKHSELSDKILFVPGIEINARYDNEKYFCSPVHFEVLAYSVNPYDKKFEAFLKKIHAGNEKIINAVIDEAKKQNNHISIEEARQRHVSIRIAGGTTVNEALLKYLEHKGIEKSHAVNIIMQHNNGMLYPGITPATPEIREILPALGNAVSSIAHPTRIKFDNQIKPEEVESLRLSGGVAAELRHLDNKTALKAKALLVLFKDFAELGGKAAEAYYQHDNKYIWSDKEKFNSYERFIFQACSALKLQKTGGIDNHGDSIFSRL